MTRERIVVLRPRTVISVAFVLLGLAVAIWIVWVSIRVLTWVFVAVFLALALDPAVRFLQAHGMRRRGAAAAVIYTSAVAVLGLLAALLLPPLIDQAEGLADAAPDYVEDITAGRGPLGFLQRDYQLVDRIREATENREGSPLGSAGTLLEFGRGVATTIVGIVTIVFLTLFMILEGPKWIERGLGLMPQQQRPRWRNVGQQIAGTVSGYVTGNLALSLIAGTSSTIVLLIMDVPFALALGLIVAVLDLIPLAGATLAGILLTTVGLLTSVTAGVVLLGFFVLYQQLENHVLQPLVYGRTVQLSPLVVLIAILVGTEVAGILGALGAIPVAGTMQIVLLDWLHHRRIRAGGRRDGDRRRGGGRRNLAAPAAHPVELLERLAGAERDALERRIGHAHGHPGLGLEPVVEAAQQRAAARQQDALLGDVGRQLGRGLLERRVHGGEDVGQRGGDRLVHLVAA